MIGLEAIDIINNAFTVIVILAYLIIGVAGLIITGKRYWLLILVGEFLVLLRLVVNWIIIAFNIYLPVAHGMILTSLFFSFLHFMVFASFFVLLLKDLASKKSSSNAVLKAGVR